MNKLLLVSFFSLALSGNLFASGGTTCTTADGTSLSVGQGRVIGSPIIGNVIVSKNDKVLLDVPKDQVVNYWVESNELKIRAIDAQAMEEILLVKITQIRTRKGKEVGTMNLTFKTSDGRSVTKKNARVTCFYE